MRSLVGHLNPPATPEKDRAISWTVIESLNLWAGFLRAYYLSGAIHTRTGSGTQVILKSTTFRDASSAIKFAIRSTKSGKFTKGVASRRDEPTWHDTRMFLSLLKKAGASNLSQVYAAFAYGAGFFDYLPTVRNFYAHRCDETFRKAADVGIKLGLTALGTYGPRKSCAPTFPNDRRM